MMNERIQKFAEQAGFSFRVDDACDDEIVRIYKTADKVEKLAELIVRECASMCDAAANNCADQVMPLMTDKLVVAGAKEQAAKLSQCIKEHFGVE
jgi:hypothetical protein